MQAYKSNAIRIFYQDKFLGCGLLIGRRIITCAHILKEIKGYENEDVYGIELYVDFPLFDATTKYSAIIKIINKENLADLALLEIVDPLFELTKKIKIEKLVLSNDMWGNHFSNTSYASFTTR